MQKKLLLAVLMLSLPALAGKQTYGDVTLTEVGTVLDGDSFYASIAGWPPIIHSNLPSVMFSGSH